MSKIYVNTKQIRNINCDVPNIVSKVSSTRRTLGMLKGKITEDIAARKQIKQRLDNMYREMDALEKQINELYRFTNSCIVQYEETENRNSRNAEMFR